MGKVNKRKMKSDDKDNTTFDLKKARLEVHRLGMKGMAGDDKELAMVRMLTKLGAKPPQNKFVNYKELLEKKRKEKEELKKNEEAVNKSGGKKLKKYDDKKRSRDRNEVKGFLDGQLKYKNGILRVPTSAVSSINKGTPGKTKFKKH